MEYVKIPYEKAREVRDLSKGDKDAKTIAAASALELVVDACTAQDLEMKEYVENALAWGKYVNAGLNLPC